MFFRNLSYSLSKFHKIKSKEVITFHPCALNSTFSRHNVRVEEIPTNTTNSIVSLPKIVKCLKDNDSKFEDGFACITTPCTNCAEKKEGLIYINKTTGNCFIRVFIP